jgi:hypothetical protein
MLAKMLGTERFGEVRMHFPLDARSSREDLHMSAGALSTSLRENHDIDIANLKLQYPSKIRKGLAILVLT